MLLAGSGDPAVAGSAATDYLRLFALTAFGWMWAKMAASAAAADTPPKVRKCAVADFFADRMLPQTLGLETAIANGATSIIALNQDLF